MGFTLVYSTVWFFDLYYGAAAALGAYGVFYLRTATALGSRADINSVFVNAVFAVVVAGVCAWTLHAAFAARFRSALGPSGFKVASSGSRRRRRRIRRDCAFLSPFAPLDPQPGGGRGNRRYRRGSVLPCLPPPVHFLSPYSLCHGYRHPVRRSGRMVRLPVVRRARRGPLLELGGVLPAGGNRRIGPVPGPVRLYAPAGSLAPDHAGGLPGHPAGHRGLYRHRL